MAIEAANGGIWRGLDGAVTLDVSRAGLSPRLIAEAEPGFVRVFDEMAALEAGAIANPDEGRRVGHYWLRAPDLAPDGLGAVIRAALDDARRLAAEIHRERRYRTALVLGIGGSALGPQLVADALAEPDDPMRVVFIDNTDPDGIARILGPCDLDETLVVCISKSGGTPETRNALVETRAAFERAGVPLGPSAVAISGEGSALWKSAEGWRGRLPMWDWVGGRTSLCSAVGLFPMLLQGIDVDAFLAGAADMDVATRVPRISENPAALLTLAWHHLGGGHGRRAMVVLPYRDRLVLLSRYLQQLVMESLGKEKDRAGRVVHQGLTVYGNKGSTDQHAYVQQLRDGPDDYFATFIGVLDDGYHGAVDVEPGLDSGDFLQGLMLGTRAALTQKGHPSLLLLLRQLDAYHLGALVALFERAVGFYASLIDVNAYDQPGVEAGKKAAAAFLATKAPVLAALTDTPSTAAEIAARAGLADAEAAGMLLARLAANQRGVACVPGASPAEDRFSRADAE